MPKSDQSSLSTASLCILSLCTMHEHFNSGGLPIFSVFRYHIWRHQPTCRPRECFWYSPAPQGGDCGRRRASEIPEKYPIDQNPPSRAAYLTSRLHDALRRSAVHLPLGVICLVSALFRRPRFGTTSLSLACSATQSRMRVRLLVQGERLGSGLSAGDLRRETQQLPASGCCSRVVREAAGLATSLARWQSGRGKSGTAVTSTITASNPARLRPARALYTKSRTPARGA